VQEKEKSLVGFSFRVLKNNLKISKTLLNFLTLGKVKAKDYALFKVLNIINLNRN